MNIPINLLSKSPQQAMLDVGAANYHTYFGLLTTPQSGYDVTNAHRWALDNGCFLPGYDAKAIRRQLERWQGVPGCIFAAMPDVVRNHEATYKLSMEWIDLYHKLGYPAAFILQDGVTLDAVPFSEIAAVFIGGSNEFKYSQVVIDICREARRLGKWIHHGRVGGKNRFKYSRDWLHINSYDSTGFSIHPKKIFEENWLQEMVVKQGTLWK
jgi:hypothetical protein